LRHFFGERGVLTSTGKLIGASCVSSILSNPIYYGHFLYKGEVHEGKHEAIISKKLFDAVETVLNRRWRYSPSENKDEPKAFLGLLHCADCGMGVTCEVQKGHTYYRCTKKNKLKWCKQPYVREEELDRQISDLLKRYSLRPDWAGGAKQRAFERPSRLARTVPKLDNNR